MVIDTSAILAIYFGEPGGAWVAEQLSQSSTELAMSSVNLTETLIRLRDRQPQRFHDLETRLLCSGIRFVAPDVAQARLAAEARQRFPLNLGDCFAYALARILGQGILTLDGDFRRLDVPVLLPP